MSGVGNSEWLPLPLSDWQDTQAGLHLRTQIVGKTRLALAPMQNHWWHTTLYVTARGLGTSAMPHGTHNVEIDFDFIDHSLVIRVSDGTVRTLPLRQQSIAEFFDEYKAALGSLDIEAHIWPQPSETAGTIRFDEDTRPLAYEPAGVERFFHVLSQVDRVLKEFRGQFLGKASPSHFWWGSFDISCTRFSGRKAPTHPGGIPNLADWVTREAYSHECISAGWWPGTIGSPMEEPAFYAYAYAEPEGCATAVVRPAGARYDTTMREWILPHAAVIAADDPDALVHEFLQWTYDTASQLGSWRPDLVR